ncbi:Crp/Fnr family transcriptional regulator [Sphingomonas sp.]|uniref:Crp/Fnr family transcriptional regulator n=1 Tax=Sphingomonas sp. TaxID=28214 RepID=UPI00286A4513|nr:Crp/Fnr family transcriptional regulator [Sphingomonas sp.]
MTLTATDDLERTDEAFARNRLLATFSPETRALLEPFSSVVDFELGSVVHGSGDSVINSYFPFGPTMVSLRIELSDGRTIEVASIGHEGAVGGIVSCGHAPAFAQAEVMVPGPALRIPMPMLEQVKAGSGHIRNLFCRFSDYLLSQVMQSVACNAFHSIEARAARWLLTAQDRAGSRIELTQEALAGLLGAQRTTVNAVARTLQDEGLIASRRGMIQVVDRGGLERRACECYAAIESHFSGIIGTSGSGAADCNADCD